VLACDCVSDGDGVRVELTVPAIVRLCVIVGVCVAVNEGVWLMLKIKFGKTKMNACIGAVALKVGLSTVPPPSK